MADHPRAASTAPPRPSAADADTDVAVDADTDPSPAPDRRRDALLLALLVAAVAIPLIVAVGVLRNPRWYPIGDDAQTELRVRDVGTGNPPLTGLGGRIGTFGEESGSHPGPLSFWSLAPTYRLFGASSWALNVATAVLNVIAMGLTLWIARRRGGPALMVAAGVALLVLTTAYGFYALTLPWNPYLPMMWWVLAVVAVWSLLCGDLPMLPVAVFATSFCLQTHISYAGLGGGLALVGVAATAYWIYRRRRDDDADLRPSLRWLGVGVGLGALLWFPPLAEQVTGSQNHNLSTIFDHFSDPPEESAGLGTGADYLLSRLDPWALLTEPAIDGQSFLGGPIGPGLALVVAWVLAVAVAGALRHWTLLRLHALLGLILVGGLVSAARIFGPPFVYLALWGWGTAALLLLAVGWSAAAGAARLAAARGPTLARSPLVPAGAAVAALVVVGLTARAAVDAADTEPFQPQLSVSSDELLPDAIDVLAEGDLPGTGRDGRYLMSWNDPWYSGGRGISLFNELDREGFDVGGSPFLQVFFTRHRVFEPSEATARVHLAAGPDIDTWDAVPGAERIAFLDPAGPKGRAEYERLEAQVIEELEAIGASELIRFLNDDPAVFQYRGGLSDEGLDRVARMRELDQPVAVFVAPPDAVP